MRTKHSFKALLVLFAIFMVASSVSAVQHHNSPFRDAEAPYITVNADPSGATFLAAVVNTDDDPLNMHLQIRREDGALIFDREFSLIAHQTRTWNLRDLPEVLANMIVTADYPQGVFHGSVKVIGDRRVLVGDFFQVDTNHNRAEGNILIPNRERCPTSCDAYVLRYLQGGAFDGGTCVQVLHRGGVYETPTIDVELFGEGGNELPGFSIPNALESSEFCLVDYTPQEPFGSAWIYPPTNDAVVTAMYNAIDRYSVGLEAWCIPPCDHCDPLGACYDYTPSCGPQCHPPLITLSPTGDSACQVGVPCHVTFVLTGTGLQPLTCDPLPDGLVRNGNTITGTATNMEIPNIHCSVAGTCGNAERSVPILPPGSTYGVNVEIGVRSKDCLPPGNNTANVSLDFPVTNTGSTSIVANLTTSIQGCSLSNINLNPGETVTHNCIHGFPFGSSTVTANVTIVGRPETDSASQTINITNCPQACDGVQPPTFNFSILSENNSTATTRSNLSYSGAGVSGTVNLSPVPGGGFLGGAATSGTNYDSIYPKTASDYLATANWQILKSGEVCFSGSETALIHRTQTCEDFPAPIIEFGTPATSQTATTFTVNSIPATPTGGVWSPNFPQTYSRPVFGQPEGSANFLYTLAYSPIPGLSCVTSATKNVSIPPQNAACENFPVTVTPGTPVTSQTATTFTVQSIPYTTSPNTAGTMMWTPNPPQTYNRPAFGQPAGSQTFNGVFTFTPATGLTCTATASKTVSIPPKDPTCSDFPVTVTPGTPVTSQTATTFTVSSIPYSTSPNTSGTGVWTPTLPDTRNRPAFGQPAGSQTYNLVFTYTPATGLTCTSAASKTVSIPPQTASCADYPTTVTPGTPVTSQTNTTFTVSSIPYTTSPSRTGTMAWTPTLPHVNNRPPFGQTASKTYTGVFTYTPVTGLTCTANASKTVTIPPQTCEVTNPPSGTLTVNHSGADFIAHSDISSTGAFDLYIYAWDNFSSCSPTATPQYEKRHVTRTLTCGQSNVLDTSYPWSTHAANGWKAQLKLGGVVIQDSGCINNNQNLWTPPSELVHN